MVSRPILTSGDPARRGAWRTRGYQDGWDGRPKRDDVPADFREAYLDSYRTGEQDRRRDYAKETP